MLQTYTLSNEKQGKGKRAVNDWFPVKKLMFW